MIEHEVQDYPGLASRPFTWEESVEKFDKLVAGRADEGDKGCRAFARKRPSQGPDGTARQRQGRGFDRVIEYDLTDSKDRSQEKGEI